MLRERKSSSTSPRKTGNRCCGTMCATPVCKVCGAPRRKDAKAYCSYACMNIARRQYLDKPCGWCGKIFRMARDTSKYCSTFCYYAKVKSENDRACLNCGFVFHKSKKGRIFCSRACTSAARKIAVAPKLCPTCGQPFNRLAWDTATCFKRRKYCSKICASAGVGKKLVKKVPVVFCLRCGSRIKSTDAGGYLAPYRVLEKKYCCWECRGAARGRA